MSPFEIPAPYNLLQYTEIAEGIWYPRGGFHKVVETLENIAQKKFDAKFIYNCGVEKILIDDDNTAKGIRLENGKEVFADIVICNADLVYAYNTLLPKTQYAEKLANNATHTPSSITFYWCMSQKIPQLDVHNVFLVENYQSNFHDIFKRYTLPEEPSFSLHVMSRIDKDAAPEGKDSIVVLIPIGHLMPGNQNRIDEFINVARRKIIKTLEKSLKIENFEQYIESEMINDPRTWQSKFNLWKGNILGLSPKISQMLYFRPSTRSNQFKNVYMVGASAHPGTGVPIVLCGAKLLEQQILTDFGLIERKSDDFQIIMEYFILIVLILMMIFFIQNFLF